MLLKDLNNLYDNYSTRGNLNDPFNSNNIIIPEFIQSLGPYSINSNMTIINLFAEEYRNNIKTYFEISNNQKSNIKEINKNSSNNSNGSNSTNNKVSSAIDDKFNEVKFNLNKIVDQIDKMKTKYLDPVSDFNSKYRLVFVILIVFYFTFFQLFSIGFLVISILYSYNDNQLYKKISLTVYHMLSFLTATILLLGLITLLFGIIVVNSNNLIKASVSEEVIKKTLGVDDAAETLHLCIYDDGDLLNHFTQNNGKLYNDVYSNIYDTLKILIRIKNYAETNESFTKLSEYFGNKKKDFLYKLSSLNSIDSLLKKAIVFNYKENINLLDILNTYSDHGLNDTVQNSCSAYTYDRYISCPNNLCKQCPIGYQNVNDENIDSQHLLQEKVCLYINNWADENKTIQRYSVKPTNCEKTNLNKEIAAHTNSVIKHINQQNNLISDLEESLRNLTISYFPKYYTKIIQKNFFLVNFSNLILNTYGDSISKYYSCSFAKGNINNILVVSSVLGNDLILIGLMFVLIGFFSLLSLYSGIVFIIKKPSITTQDDKSFKDNEAEKISVL